MLNQEITQNSFAINPLQKLSRQKINEAMDQISNVIENFNIFHNELNNQYYNFIRNHEPQPKIVCTKVRRKREKHKFGAFLAKIILEKQYSLETLVNIYNNLFYSNIMPQGLGQMIEIKQCFNKTRRKINGTNLTLNILK